MITPPLVGVILSASQRPHLPVCLPVSFLLPRSKSAHCPAVLNQTEKVLAPAWWNTLPSDICTLQDLGPFHRACKTELFCQTYG